MSNQTTTALSPASDTPDTGSVHQPSLASELRLGKPAAKRHLFHSRILRTAKAVAPTLEERRRTSATPVKGFSYVYTLQSKVDAEHFYVGLTDNLAERLAKHNAGGVPYTSKFRPWHLKSAVAFRDRTRAAEFERYLKTASGRAFAKKRL